MYAHKDEEKVKVIISLDKNKDKVQRRTLLKALRLKGDFYHNIKTLKTGGELIVIRRPASGVKVSHAEFLPCKFCYGFIHSVQLRRHAKQCSSKNLSGDLGDENNGGIIKQAELLLYPNKVSIFVF